MFRFELTYYLRPLFLDVPQHLGRVIKDHEVRWFGYQIRKHRQNRALLLIQFTPQVSHDVF
jgi:hypothetical protein